MTTHHQISESAAAVAAEMQRNANAIGEGEVSPVEMAAMGERWEAQVEDLRQEIRSLRG